LQAKAQANSAPHRITQAAAPPPADWVALAEVGAPIGLKGAVRVSTYGTSHGLQAYPSLLFEISECWLRLAHGQWLQTAIDDCSAQTRGLKVHFKEINDRNAAELIRGAVIGCSRSAFPETSPEEHYWSDLMGCQVINRQGLLLGSVVDMKTNGEYDWLVLDAGWIPFVDPYVDAVDLAARRITVDWDPSWFN